ncbi:DNA helicase [Frigidibacter mobilis]|uniref:Circadian clock protein KaiC central region n=1 Tax=Frigidibacter mobilis TaxID=1335048 RepID=A0A159Z4R8_9RHOB|nr:DNA helicase [Frigidibacter mobilis]AMY70201.1 Circadian clock protein KaiC central region [Frigidibacter mobilis]
MRLSAPIYQLKRRARLLSRRETIPLHDALDRIAQAEGLASWSLLASRVAQVTPANELLARLAEGDMLLIGARPGQGKTRLGLQLLLDALHEGRRAVFFTLEYTDQQALERMQALDPGLDRLPEIVTSEAISAGVIVRHLADAPRGTVAVIDYLQILDQQRSKPMLAEQMAMLQEFARQSGVILGFISQIDRSFDPGRAPVPGPGDIRLPNPIPAGVFSKSCFLHGGEVRMQ